MTPLAWVLVRETLLFALALTQATDSTDSTDSLTQLLADAVGEYRAALDASDRVERLARFRRSELLFDRLVAGDHRGNSIAIHNAELYVNLGNAALGAERLGAAILAYRRALGVDPDHRRARQNLRHARTLLPEWVPRPGERGLLDSFFAWRDRLSQSGLRIIAAATFLLAALLVAAAIRWRQSTLRVLAVLAGIGWVILLAWITWRGPEISDAHAVVIVPEVIARAADSIGAPARWPQPLPAGTELELLETRDGWSRVRLFDGRDAWLPQSALEKVNRS